MSNTATTALMLALIAPALAQIPPDDPFRKALLLPVPVSANVAGMSTPIASPPNAIAVSYLARESAAIGCQVWMAAAVPIVIVLLLVTWWRLRRLFPAAGVRWRIEFPDTTITRRGVLVMIMAIVRSRCFSRSGSSRGRTSTRSTGTCSYAPTVALVASLSMALPVSTPPTQ